MQAIATRRPRIATCIAAPCAAVLLGLAACGGSGDGGSDEQADTTPPGAGPRPAPTQPRDQAPAPQGGSRGVRLEPIGTFAQPTYVTSPPGEPDRLFVVEKGGTIRIVDRGETLPEPFLDLEGDVSTGGEQGLLSMAFAPDYERSRRFYVDYTDPAGTTRVVEYRASAENPDAADPGSAREILSQEQPEANHNGGQLQFGPDGMLYVGFGDGGGAGDQHGTVGNGQDLSTWLGKILRIDPTPSAGAPYTVPPDNPFVGRDGARPEIYTYGLRNPWRFSFDRETGALTIGDVGQDAVEEIDFAPRGRAAGANFGWRAFEGSQRFDPAVEAPDAIGPAIEHTHEEGWCSITGGYVIRDPALPALAGRYVYGDFCQQDLWLATLRLQGSGDDRPVEGVSLPAVASFGEDARGRVYVVSLEGEVARIVPR